jgi:hypothetical protein
VTETQLRVRGKLQRVQRCEDDDFRTNGTTHREVGEDGREKRSKTQRTPWPAAGCNKPVSQYATSKEGPSSGEKPTTGYRGTSGMVSNENPVSRWVDTVSALESWWRGHTVEQSMDWTKSHERRPTLRGEKRGDAKANTDREKLCREGEVHEGGQHTMKTLRVPLTTASAPSVKAEKERSEVQTSC